MTQLDDDGRDRVIAFFSKKLSLAEQNYTANDRELLGLVYFLQRFRCYLEGTSFEIFTDNQVLKHFFTKPKLSRREARWLETLGNFGIFPITLKPGKIHVLGDTLSRAPHASMNSVEILSANVEEIWDNYENDRVFGPLLKVMKGERLKDIVQQRKLRNWHNTFIWTVRNCYMKASYVYHVNQYQIYCRWLMTVKWLDTSGTLRPCQD